MDYWSPAPMKREQTVLFAPRLDEMIGEDHPLRLFAEILIDAIGLHGKPSTTAGGGSRRFTLGLWPARFSTG